MQMIFQDPYASLNPRWQVHDIVGEPLTEHGLIRDRDALRAASPSCCSRSVCARCGEVSAPVLRGQRQRISIARALATQPEFLVCDEPTSALDVSVQAQVLNIMKDLQRSQGLTCLFISHNLAVAARQRPGRRDVPRPPVELADKADLFGRPRHPYTRMLLDAIPDIHMTGRARNPVQGEVAESAGAAAGCLFHPRCPHADARCRTERPAQRAVGGALVACHAVEEGRIGRANLAAAGARPGTARPAGRGRGSARRRRR